MAETKPDTVPGLGFKDKEKAQETIKNLEGRDPDYQKLAIKGLIGRAKRTLTLTKDKDKLQNINDAVAIFEQWISSFERKNLSKENKAYLPLATIDTLMPLQQEYKIANKKAAAFLTAYKKAGADYKNLRTVASGEDEPTWDIVRNKELKKLLKEIDEKDSPMWKDDVPTKEHMELILWAYSPEASRIKKNLSKFEEKFGKASSDSSKSDDDVEMKEEKKGDKKKKEEKEKPSKRKSDSESSSSNDESPKKKNRKE